jgi:peroxiredoxin
MRPQNNYFEFLAGEPRIDLTCNVANPINSMIVRHSTENEIFYDYMRYSAQRGQLADSLTRVIQSRGADTVGTGALRAQALKASQEVYEYRQRITREKPNSFVARLFAAMADPDVPNAPTGLDSAAAARWQYDRYRADFLPRSMFTDAGILRSPVFHPRLMRYFERVIPQHWDSIAAECIRVIDLTVHDTTLFQYTLVTLLNKYANSNIMCMEAVYVALVDKYYRNGNARWVADSTRQKMLERADAWRPLRCGCVAPDLELWEWTGRPHRLSSLDADYTILYFFDPSCGHCKKTSPKLARVFDKYRDYGVAWFAVCTGGAAEDWKKFVEEHQMHGINVADIYGRTGYKSIYDVNMTPVLFVLDRQKRIVAKRLGAEQVDEFLARQLGFPLPASATDGPTQVNQDVH